MTRSSLLSSGGTDLFKKSILARDCLNADTVPKARTLLLNKMFDGALILFYKGSSNLN
jgi:hypothetical protein